MHAEAAAAIPPESAGALCSAVVASASDLRAASAHTRLSCDRPPNSPLDCHCDVTVAHRPEQACKRCAAMPTSSAGCSPFVSGGSVSNGGAPGVAGSGSVSRSLTLLQSFPAPTARLIALPAIVALDGGGQGQADHRFIDRQAGWGDDQTRWSMECVGWAFTMPLTGSAPSSSAAAASAPAPSPTEDNLSLIHCSLNIYTRWMVGSGGAQSGWIGSCDLGERAAFLQRMFRHLSALFEPRGVHHPNTGTAVASSPVAGQAQQQQQPALGSTPSGAAGNQALPNSHSSSAGFTGGPSSPGSLSTSDATGIPSSSSSSAHQSHLDARIVGIGARALQLLLAMTRQADSPDARRGGAMHMDAATWRGLLQALLRIADCVLSRGQRCSMSLNVCAMLEGLCLRTLLDAWLRAGCTDPDVWSALASLARRCVHSRWLVRLWRVTTQAISHHMWRSVFSTSSPTAAGSLRSPPPPSAASDLLTFRWPCSDIALLESVALPAGVLSMSTYPLVASGSIAMASTVSAVHMGSTRATVFAWNQWINVYGRAAVLDLLGGGAAAAKVKPVVAVSPASVEPKPALTASRTLVSGSATAYLQPLALHSPSSSSSPSATAAASIGSRRPGLPDFTAPPAMATSPPPAPTSSPRSAAAAGADVVALAAEAALAAEKIDRSERADVYRCYVEGVCAMVDTFLQHPRTAFATASANGGFSPAAAGAAAPRLLPQNLNFVLSTFGELLFEIAESAVPTPSGSSGAGAATTTGTLNSSSSGVSPNSPAASSPSVAAGSSSQGGEDAGAEDGFDVGRSMAVGALMRIFTCKAFSSETAVMTASQSASPSAAAASSNAAGAWVSDSAAPPSSPKDPSISLSSLSRFYALLIRLLSSHSSDSSSLHPAPLVVCAIFAHGSRLFSQGLPAVHTVFPSAWPHCRNFLAQSGAPDTNVPAGVMAHTTTHPTQHLAALYHPGMAAAAPSTATAGTSPSSPAATGSASVAAAAVSVSQKQYLVLTRIRRNCVRMLANAIALSSCSSFDAAKVSNLLVAQEAVAAMAADADDNRASSEAPSASAPPSPSACASALRLTPLDSFFLSHSSALLSSLPFFQSQYSSFPHILLNSLFSEHDGANIHQSLWTLLHYMHEEQSNLGQNRQASNLKPTLFGGAAGGSKGNGSRQNPSVPSMAPSTMMRAEPVGPGSGSHSSGGGRGGHPSAFSLSLSTFPHMLLTTLWKLVIEEIWASDSLVSALGVLAALSHFHALIHHTNRASIKGWMYQLARYGEKKLAALASLLSSASNASISGIPVTAATLAEIYAGNQVLLHVCLCVEAWIKACPSILSSVATNVAPTPIAQAQAGGTMAGPTAASAASPSPLLLATGSKELTRSLIELLMKGLNYGLSAQGHSSFGAGSSAATASRASILADGASVESHFLYQMRAVQASCLATLKFVLYDAADATVSMARSMSSAALESAAGAPRAQALAQLRSLRQAESSHLTRLSASAHPLSPIPCIVRGLLSPLSGPGLSLLSSLTSSGCTAARMQQGGALLTESFYLSHLVRQGMLPASASLERNVKWLLLRGSVLVSAIVFHASPAAAAAGPPPNESQGSTASLVLFVRDLMGLIVVGARNVLAPSAAATQLARVASLAAQGGQAAVVSSPPSYHHRGSTACPAADDPRYHPLQAADAPEDKFAEAILYLERIDAAQHAQAQETARQAAAAAAEREAQVKRKAEEEVTATATDTLPPSLTPPLSLTPQPSSSGRSSPAVRVASASGSGGSTTSGIISREGALPTPLWLAAQREAETHRLYAKIMAQQASNMTEDEEGIPATATGASKQQHLALDSSDDEKKQSSCCPNLPPSSTGLESVRALLSNLGWLAKLAPSAATSPGGRPDGLTPHTTVELLKPTPGLLSLVEQLDYGGLGGTGGGATTEGSPAQTAIPDSPLHQVAILYRQRGQHTEAELYANDTGGMDADEDHGVDDGRLRDPAYEQFLEAMRGAGAGRPASGVAAVEYLVASRMHRPRPAGTRNRADSAAVTHHANASAAHTESVRAFVQSHASLRIVFSRDPTDFVPSFSAADTGSATPPHTGPGPPPPPPSATAIASRPPVVYIVVWPHNFDDHAPAEEEGGVEDDGAATQTVRASPGIDARLPRAYRVQILCSAAGGAGGLACCCTVHTTHNSLISRLEEAEALVAASFVAAPHPKDRARAEKEAREREREKEREKEREREREKEREKEREREIAAQQHAAAAAAAAAAANQTQSKFWSRSKPAKLLPATPISASGSTPSSAHSGASTPANALTHVHGQHHSSSNLLAGSGGGSGGGGAGSSGGDGSGSLGGGGANTAAGASHSSDSSSSGGAVGAAVASAAHASWLELQESRFDGLLQEEMPSTAAFTLPPMPAQNSAAAGVTPSGAASGPTTLCSASTSHSCLLGGPLSSHTLVESLSLPFLLHHTALHWLPALSRELSRRAAAASSSAAGVAAFVPPWAQRQALMNRIASLAAQAYAPASTAVASAVGATSTALLSAPAAASPASSPGRQRNISVWNGAAAPPAEIGSSGFGASSSAIRPPSGARQREVLVQALFAVE